MADATRSQLEQAYRLIQQEDLDKAIAILRPITVSQPDNADAWWLLANAVSEPKEAHEALSQVVRLRPSHAEAHDLLAKLQAEYPSLGSGASTSTGFSDSDPGFDDIFGATDSQSAGPASASSALSSDDLDALLNDRKSAQTSSSGSSRQQDLDAMLASDDGTLEDPFASSGPQFVQDPDLEPGASGSGRRAKPPKPQREGRPKPVRVTAEKPPLDALELEKRANRRPNLLMPAVVVIVLIILAGAGLVGANILGLLGTPGPAGPTAEQQALVVSITSTNAQLVSSGYKNPQTAVVASSQGSSFTVQICTTGGPDLQSKVYKVMDIVATAAAAIKDQIKGVGVQFVSCSSAGVWLYRATAPIDAVLTYVNGGMTDKKTFHASWVKS